jgi:hypothetical protein
MSEFKGVSAVDYLIEHLKETYHLTEETLYEFQKAEKMFEEQIIDAYAIGKYLNQDDRKLGEQYYNETYGKKNKQ